MEQVLDRIGSRAHGVVTREHLLAAGVTAKEIRHRIEVGALIRVHRGVYRVGHRRRASKPITSPLSLHAAKTPFCVAAPPGTFTP